MSIFFGHYRRNGAIEREQGRQWRRTSPRARRRTGTRELRCSTPWTRPLREPSQRLAADSEAHQEPRRETTRSQARRLSPRLQLPLVRSRLPQTPDLAPPRASDQAAPLTARQVMKNVDQQNITYAYTSGMQEDLHLFGNQLNYFGMSFNIGYGLFLIPSQVMITYFRPALWLSLLELFWGALTVLVAWARTPTQIYVIRLFIGMAESSAYPGIVSLLSEQRCVGVLMRSGVVQPSGDRETDRILSLESGDRIHDRGSLTSGNLQDLEWGIRLCRMAMELPHRRWVDITLLRLRLRSHHRHDRYLCTVSQPGLPQAA